MVSGLIQFSDMAKSSVSLSKINFAMAEYLFVYGSNVCIGDIQKIGCSWVWVDITSKQE